MNIPPDFIILLEAPTNATERGSNKYLKSGVDGIVIKASIKQDIGYYALHFNPVSTRARCDIVLIITGLLTNYETIYLQIKRGGVNQWHMRQFFTR
ncbi:MAG: hypothetical protein NTZ34_10970 [Chloroflexi bacterium]|nr:hypothetical protein [Chloroflexota bacterium]